MSNESAWNQHEEQERGQEHRRNRQQQPYRLLLGNWANHDAPAVRALQPDERLTLIMCWKRADQARGKAFGISHAMVSPHISKRRWCGTREADRRPYPGILRVLAASGFIRILRSTPGMAAVCAISDAWKQGDDPDDPAGAAVAQTPHPRTTTPDADGNRRR